MVRYFPHACPAVNPAYPHIVDYCPANHSVNIFSRSGLLGTFVGLARYTLNYTLNRQSRGLFMRSAAICAVVSVPWSALQVRSRNRQAAELGFVRGPKRAYLASLGRIDVDDWYLIGALLGAVVAMVPVRRPGVTGWKRYIGAASLASSGSHLAHSITSGEEYIKALALQEELRKQLEANST